MILEAVDLLRVFESIGGATDIILTGADGSALPLSHSKFAIPSNGAGAKPCFLDDLML